MTITIFDLLSYLMYVRNSVLSKKLEVNDSLSRSKMDDQSKRSKNNYPQHVRSTL